MNTIFQKALEQLEVWAVTYKLIGSPGETPRYAQILSDDYETYYLESTVSAVKYKLDLTPEEVQRLNMDGSVWEKWRDIRNEYLRVNHPTIELFNV